MGDFSKSLYQGISNIFIYIGIAFVIALVSTVLIKIKSASYHHLLLLIIPIYLVSFAFVISLLANFLLWMFGISGLDIYLAIASVAFVTFIATNWLLNSSARG